MLLSLFQLFTHPTQLWMVLGLVLLAGSISDLVANAVLDSFICLQPSSQVIIALYSRLSKHAWNLISGLPFTFDLSLPDLVLTGAPYPCLQTMSESVLRMRIVRICCYLPNIIASSATPSLLTSMSEPHLLRPLTPPAPPPTYWSHWSRL